MTNLKLDQYVETVSASLKTLPETERQNQIDELRQHLHSLVMARLAEGENEETATEAALKQFGSAREVGADLGRSVWRMRLKRLPESVVTALSVTAAMAISTLFFQYGVGPLIRAFVPALPPLSDLPAHTVTVIVTHIALVTPSLILGLAALALLLLRDGAVRTFRGLLNPKTIAGAALLWVVLSRLGGSILSVSLGHALLAKGVWDMDTLKAIIPVFSLVPAAAAAWIVTRVSPHAGMTAIASTILVSTLACLVDIAARSGSVNLIFGQFLLSFAVTSVPYGAVAMAFAFLASVLNRRQRYERAA